MCLCESLFVFYVLGLGHALAQKYVSFFFTPLHGSSACMHFLASLSFCCTKSQPSVSAFFGSIRFGVLLFAATIFGLLGIASIAIVVIRWLKFFVDDDGTLMDDDVMMVTMIFGCLYSVHCAYYYVFQQQQQPQQRNVFDVPWILFMRRHWHTHSFLSIFPSRFSLSSHCMTCFVCLSVVAMLLFWFCFRFARINVKVVAVGQTRAPALCVLILHTFMYVNVAIAT